MRQPRGSNSSNSNNNSKGGLLLALFTAPRALKDPVLCSLSSLRCTEHPVRLLSHGEGSTGVRSTWGSMRQRASMELTAIGLRFCRAHMPGQIQKGCLASTLRARHDFFCISFMILCARSYVPDDLTTNRNLAAASLALVPKCAVAFSSIHTFRIQTVKKVNRSAQVRHYEPTSA